MTWTTRALRGVAAGVVIALLASCQSAPVTGRKQLILVPESQDAQLGCSSTGLSWSPTGIGIGSYVCPTVASENQRRNSLRRR